MIDSREPAKHRSPIRAKIVIALQSLVIAFLGYWAIEEYQNNIYFQSYVNTTLQANVLMILGIVVIIPTAGAGLFFLKRRGNHATGHLTIDTLSQSPRGSFGTTGSSTAGSEQKVSPIYAELSSRFLGQSIANPNTANSQPSQSRTPVLQRVAQENAARAKSEQKLPVLERVETPQPTPQQRQEAPRYQAPRQFNDSTQPVPPRDAGYSPPPPNFPRPPENTGMRRPPISAPTTRPSTVVTGIMGPSPQPYAPASPAPQSQIRQAPTLSPPPVQGKWEPGARPPGPLVSMPQRPTPFNQQNPTSSTPPFTTNTPSQPSQGLGRIGPPRAPGDKTTSTPPGLNRVEPMQAVANKIPWPKNKLPTSDEYNPPSLDQASNPENPFSDSLTPDKGLPLGKRDDKRLSSTENSGS